MELYVFDNDLNLVGLVDGFTSLIWAKRYNSIGDCEVYIQASPENISLLRKGYYLERTDDDMICRIKKIELDTDVEHGDYLIVTAYDAKDILGQRIIWNPLNFTGTVENYILRIIRDAFNMQQLELNPPVRTQRQILNFKILDRVRNLNDGISEQVSYENVKDKVESLCKTYNYGYKAYRDGKNIMFDLYRGRDRSDTVVFSPQYDNLLSTKYVEDVSGFKNVALVGGIGEGKDKITQTSNHTSGIDRYEMYVNANGVSNSISWAEMKLLYPPREQGGIGYMSVISPTYIAYRLDYLDVILIDNIQFNELKDIYITGSICYKDTDNEYRYIAKDNKTLDQLQALYPNKILMYQIYTVIAANLVTADMAEDGTIIPPKDTDNVTLANVIYDDYLLNKGYEEIAKRGMATSFEGKIEPSTTFKYKDDYDLGDLVMVENEYGIHSKARITEVVETFDENGYSVEPRFEFMEVI